LKRVEGLLDAARFRSLTTENPGKLIG
jgi:hypothetical protein